MIGKGYINFIKYKWYLISISFTVMIVGIILFFANDGFEMGPDFEGGAIITYQMVDKEKRPISNAEFQALFRVHQNWQITPLKDNDPSSEYRIEVPLIVDTTTETDQDLIMEQLYEKFNQLLGEQIVPFLNDQLSEAGDEDWEYIVKPYINTSNNGVILLRVLHKSPVKVPIEDVQSVFDDQIQNEGWDVELARGTRMEDIFRIRFPFQERPTININRPTLDSYKNLILRLRFKFRDDIVVPIMNAYDSESVLVKKPVVDLKNGEVLIFVDKNSVPSQSDLANLIQLPDYQILSQTDEEGNYQISYSLSSRQAGFAKGVQTELERYILGILSDSYSEISVESLESSSISFDGEGTTKLVLSQSINLLQAKELMGEEIEIINEEPEATEISMRFLVMSDIEYMERIIEDTIETPLVAKFEQGVFDRQDIEYYHPTIGQELQRTAFLSSTLVIALILLYVAMRFKFNFSIGAIVCLVHDALIVLAFVLILDREISVNIIIAVLTILGFSINDTIIVFDRIRETMQYAKSEDFPTIVNRSITQTLSRTIITSLTVIMADLCLIIWGGDALYDLSLALMVGLISGTYSSIYIAAPVVVFLEGRKKRDRKKTQLKESTA